MILTLIDLVSKRQKLILRPKYIRFSFGQFLDTFQGWYGLKHFILGVCWVCSYSGARSGARGVGGLREKVSLRI